MTPRIVSWGGNEDSISPVISSAGSITPVVSSESFTLRSIHEISNYPCEASRADLTGPGARPASFLGMESGESETPAGTLRQSDDSFIRHNKYFFKDGNITFLVRHVIWHMSPMC